MSLDWIYQNRQSFICMEKWLAQGFWLTTTNNSRFWENIKPYTALGSWDGVCVAMRVQVWSPRAWHQRHVTLHAEGVRTPELEHRAAPAATGGRTQIFVLPVKSWQSRESDWWGKGSYKHNSTRVLQLSNSTTKCFIHLPLLFGGRRSSPEAPAIILLVAFQWQYSQLPEALINKIKIHNAKLEHTTINNIFLFAGQVNSLCKELLCWLLSSQKRILCFSSISEVMSELWF